MAHARATVRWCTGIAEERRLVGVHAAHSAANAALNTSLIGTVVIALDGTAQQDRLFGYLLFTLAPFAIAAPLIGWAVPRSGVGARTLLAWSFLARAALAVLLVAAAPTTLAYPLVFAVLVGQRVHTVALYGCVPTLLGVGPARLHANARLNRAAAVAGAAGGGVGVLASALVGPWAGLLLAAAATWRGRAAVHRIAGLVGAPARSARPLAVTHGDLVPVVGLRAAAFGFAGTRAAAGALTAGFAGALATGDDSAALVAVLATSLALGGIAGSVIGPHVLERCAAGTVRVAVATGFATAATVGALVPRPPLAAVAALCIGLGGSVVRQHRDDRIQHLPSDRCVHLGFVRWDALAQAGWVGCALAVTAARLPIADTFVLVAGVAVVTLVAMLATSAVGRREVPDLPLVTAPAAAGG